MYSFEDEMAKAVKINLQDTFNFLDELAIGYTGVIKSATPTISDLSITFQKADGEFTFSTGPIHRANGPGHYQHINYGFSKPFSILTDKRLYKIDIGVGRSNSMLAKGFETTGGLYNVDSINGTDLPKHYRAVYTLAKTMKAPVQYFLGKSFSNGSSIRGYGLITIHIRDAVFYMYDFDRDKKTLLFIETVTPTTLKEFKSILECIIFSYGLISGALVRNEELVLQSSDNIFSKITGFTFKKTRESIDSPIELINPRDHKDWLKLETTRYMGEDIFSSLVSLCAAEKRLLRAVKIIAQARDNPLELEAAAYCVALETVKEYILSQHKIDILPIKDEETAIEIKNKLKEVIDSYNNDHFRNKAGLIQKIEYINQVSNNESFAMAFALVGIALSPEEKKYLANRNRFLHGNIPFENEDDEHQMELHKVSLHIQLLTSCLILKLAGYKGAVINFWKLWELKRGENKDPTPLFRDI